MPLFYQHNINESTRVGIWRIEEAEAFFQAKVPLKKDVSHPHKRLQHLAGRYLLPALFNDFPLNEIIIADTRKPFLENEKYHFSISHCGDFAAAIVSSNQRVGVDIELVTPKISRIRHKFLLSDEAEAFQALPVDRSVSHDDALLETIVWSAKESIYKWYGVGQLDFKKHMQLQSVANEPDGWIQMDFQFEKNDRQELQVHCRRFDKLILTWLVTSPDL